MNLAMNAKEKEEMFHASRYQYEDFTHAKVFDCLQKQNGNLQLVREVLLRFGHHREVLRIPMGIEFSCEEEQFLTDGTAIR